jgi:undecaprenyl-diphosphatase
MNILQALGLGVLQGLTEFLPVSSSGHLVLAQHLFGLKEPQLFFDVAVHGGTLMSIFVVFRSDMRQILKDCLTLLHSPRQTLAFNPTTEATAGVKMVLMIFVGSIPTALIGLILRDFADRLFASITVVGISLLVTGLLLVWSRWSRPHRSNLSTPSPVDALLIGLVQGAAITPGLSRSGATITVGLLRGLRPELAFRFSFLLSIPAILGATVLEALQAGSVNPGWHVVGVGFFFAFLVGWAALRLLLAVVGRGKLFSFAPYCFVLGTAALIVGL